MTGPLPASGDALVVRDLSVDFPGVAAVRGVSFTLRPGECVALVGESGSGKSVTARALLGMAGDHARVRAAELRLGDVDLARLDAREWRRLRGRRIGMALQDALVSLDQLRTVGAEVAEAPRVHGLWRRAEAAGRVQDLLARVGVPDPALRARQHPHQLSGGLRQRALIASALSAEPAFLIADEPTTALDVTVQAQVLRVLGDLVRSGSGLLLISHDLAVVAALADRVLVLADGEVLEEGPPDQVLTAPRHDGTRALVRAVPAFATRGTRLSGEASQAGQLVTGAARPDGAGPPAAPVLAAESASRVFDVGRGRELVAVDDVSLTLGRGEILGVVGESGSGKSTLGRLLLGFDRPTSGRVLLDGRPWSETRERDRRARRGQIQLVSQDPLSSFDPRHGVDRVLGEALATAGVPRGQRRERSAALLAAVGLDGALLDRHPRTLSGGQRQRVAIARALGTGARVLVCDEIVSALDVSVQAQVLDLLLDLRAAAGLSLVFVSHDLGVVHYLADRVLVMTQGRVVESGDVETVFRDPAHPYTRALLDALPRLPTPGPVPVPDPVPARP